MRAAARTVASRRPERRLRMVHMASRRRAARGRRLVSETQQDEEESAAEALEASDSADSGAEDNAGDVEEIRRRAASAAQLGRVRLPSWLPLRRASSPLGEMKCLLLQFLSGRLVCLGALTHFEAPGARLAGLWDRSPP